MRMTRTIAEAATPFDSQWHTWLAAMPVGRLGTLDAHGAPHLVPVVFVLMDGALWIPVDGKAKRSSALARLRHLRADARCCVLVDSYADDWSQLRWLRLDGVGEVRSLNDQEIRALTAAFRGKYPQYEHVAPLPPPATAIRFAWQRTAQWRSDSGVETGQQSEAGADNPY